VLDVCHNSVTAKQHEGHTCWLHRKGAAPSDQGPVVIPGSRGALSYLVLPLGDGAGHAYSLAHGAGRKWTRTSARERMRISKPEYIGPVTDVTTVWKEGQFNSFRIRMVGEAPRVTLWINDTKMWELQMPKNDQIAGVYGGQIGLQLHWTATYSDASGSGGSSRPWLVQRFRNIAIKELK